MVLVFYTDTDLTQAALDLIANLEPSDLVVRDALLVDGDRYWSLMCEDPECCPPQGNPSPTSTSVLEAEQALCGHPTVARSREEVAARFTPRPDLAPTREDFRTAADLQRLPVQVRCDTAWECLSTLARSRPESDREVVSVVRAGLLVLIRDTLVRDYVLASVAATDTDTALALTDALVGLALTAPEGLRAVPAAAAAAVLAMTGTCPVGARELLALGEGQSLATLVESALDQALPPEQIREAFSQALLEIEHLISDDTHEVHSTSTVAGGAA